MAELWQLSATQLGDAYRKQQATPREVAESILDRIDEGNSQLNAYTFIDRERALAAADRALTSIKSGDQSPLCGVPVAIKEIYAVEGLPWTAQSHTREGIVAYEDAAMVRQLRDAGAVIIGMTRTHEMAWGITTQHEQLGGTKNPWNPAFTPGGSSGGSAVAVANGMATVALGSDTGGSIRIPAAFCGIAGFKPTLGAVDADGMLPHAPRFDHPGWLARKVEDLAVLFEIFADRPGTEQLRLADITIGVACINERLGSAQRNAFDAIATAAKGEGVNLIQSEWPPSSAVFQTYRDLQAIDAIIAHRDIHGTWPSQAHKYGADVRSRLEYGEVVTPAMRAAAEERLTELKLKWTRALAEVDVVLMPVSSSGPSRIVDPDWVTIDGERVPLRDAVIGFNAPANMLGAPACAIPAGRDSDGIPIGVQIVGKPGSDAKVLSVAQHLSELNAPIVNELWPKSPRLG